MKFEKYFFCVLIIGLLQGLNDVYAQVPPTPNTTFSIIASCEKTSVTWKSTPPENVIWYWMKSANGTSSDNLEVGGLFGETVFISGSSTDLYLRARSKSWPYSWSEAAQFVGYIEVAPRPCVYVKLVGPTVVELGDQVEYKAEFSDADHNPIPGPTIGLDISWIAMPDNIEVNTSNSYSCAVTWTKKGTFQLYYQLRTDSDPYFPNVDLSFFREVKVVDPVIPLPNTTFLVEKNCESTVVRRSSEPPAKNEWYWQESSDGKDLSLGNAPVITRYKTSNLYLRPRLKNSPHTWGNSSQLVGNIIVSAKGCLPLPYTPQVAPSPTPSRNYISTKIPRIPGIKSESTLDNFSQYRSYVQSNVQYLDGIGRPGQTVHHQASPLGYDIVQPIAFDVLGREPIKYLPYISTSGAQGSYRPHALRAGTDSDYSESEQYKFYTRSLDDDKIAPSVTPFSLSVYEPSPLNRVSKQGAPGEDWQPDYKDISQSTDHTKKMVYNLNQANEVIQFSYDLSTGNLGAKENGTYKYYGANQLYANKTIDEHQNEKIEYVDKDGRMVLKKVQLGEDSNGVKQYASTYFIYDDLGSLILILPPEAINAILQN